ncbi:hypothetical protein EZS27_005397 [termite gut metagenome]|uniref:O-antigen ligase domain-containing protein n=1 Tax=termite gut metagenome TaxID=433724 RepID=A0A5J4SLK9_9ZZZZ
MNRNYKTILANINAILLIVGYPLFTSIVFNSNFESEGTRAYSVVYRAFALIIALLTIVAHGIRRPKSLDAGIISFWVLWFLYTCRVIYDLFIRTESYLVSDADKQFLIFLTFGGILIPSIAFFLSRKNIDFEKIFKWLFFLLLFVVLKGVFSNSVSLNTGRASLNVAQSSLEFGTFGSILSMQSFTIITNNMKFKKVAWGAFLLGLYAVGFAASRGPFVSLLIVLFCYLLTRGNLKTIIMILIFVMLGFFYENVIIDLLSTEFPTLMGRMDLTVHEFDTGGRDKIFVQAIEQFVNNPLFGDWFLLDPTDTTSSAHNAIIGAFSCMGLLGGISMITLYITLLIKSFKLLKYNSYLSFYASLCLFLIFYSITSGGFLMTKLNFNFAFLAILIISKKFLLNKYEYKK